MAIYLDETNLYSEVVGEEHGLTPAEREQGAGAARDALKSFQDGNFGKHLDDSRYGFPHLPFQTDTIKEVLRYAAEIRGSFDTVCLIGIGGSALGAWALDCGIRGPHPVQGEHSTSFPRLVILDNIDPFFVENALNSMKAKRTLAVVIAKSGATAETMAVFLIVRDWLEQKLGKRAARHIVAVTSAGTGDLKQLATAEGYRTFHIPANVGGRFSVLSPVGLVPAALIGLDIRKLAKGAAEMTAKCWQDALEENIALRAAMLHYLVWTRKNKSIQVAFPYSNQLWGTAFWFRQLWAESLGKSHSRSGERVHVGQTPVAALGTTDQHSQVQLYMEGPNDKVFTFWAVGKSPAAGKIPRARTGLEAIDYLAGQSLSKLLEAERQSTAAALTAAGRPNCTFTLDRVDEAHLGAFLQMMEFQTAFTGEMLNINAFDQEGVELGKKFTFALMGRKGFDEYKERFAAYEARRGDMSKAAGKRG
jgi:glucose-6-phosphate isomerase